MDLPALSAMGALGIPRLAVRAGAHDAAAGQPVGVLFLPPDNPGGTIHDRAILTSVFPYRRVPAGGGPFSTGMDPGAR